MCASSNNDAEQIQALRNEIQKLRKRVKVLESIAHRYRRSPFDYCYRAARKVKRGISNARAERKLTRTLPSISVIIPTYKTNDYLQGCVRSVLKQKYPKTKIKIIISVNGDDKPYFELLKNKYAQNNNIQVIYTPKKGAAAARNYAKQYISTDYVTYLDDDDYFTRGYLRELARHTTPDVSIVCGRAVDIHSDGKQDCDTYINQSLSKFAPGIRANYFEVAAHFASLCFKLYDSKLILDVFEDINETLPHTEDTIFWIENIYKIQGQIYSCDSKNAEAYMRRITTGSRSRPVQEHDYEFYITDQLELIERISKEVFRPGRDMIYREFVLGKINTTTNRIQEHFSSFDNDLKAKARNEIFSQPSPFMNKSIFAEKHGFVFCYNFAPFVDASAYVATKRLPQLAAYIGEPINWTIVSADLSHIRKKDVTWVRCFARYQYSEKVTVGSATNFNEDAQFKWAFRAYQEFKNQDVDYIYSRSMSEGSHEAAYLYKLEHPNVVWFAEVADPIYMGVSNKPRPVAKEYTGELEFLNSYHQDIESRACNTADVVIFSNENQRTYILKSNPKINVNAVMQKSLVWQHPQLPTCYTQIMESDLTLDEDKINIGYFGSFYHRRGFSSMLEFLRDPRIDLYVFTSNPKSLEITDQLFTNLHVLPMVPHLEFLNLAHRMDYCYLSDLDFPGPINPYLPSKLADYFSADATVIALTYPGTSVDQTEDPRLIKVRAITPEFVSSLQRRASTT